jgi:hypothetical protein
LRRPTIELRAGTDFGGIVFRVDCRWSARALIAAALIWGWSEQLASGRQFVTRRHKQDRTACGDPRKT